MSFGKINLTGGAMKTIFDGGHVEKPVLQILSSKRIFPGDRYRIFLSDGEIASSFAMLSTNGDDDFDIGNVNKFSVIQVNKYTCSETVENDKMQRVINVCDFTMVADGHVVGGKIGEPRNVNSTTTSTSVSEHTLEKAKRDDAESPLPTVCRDTMASQNDDDYANKEAKRMRQKLVPTDCRTIQTISCVTPYQEKWTIKARVTSKSQIGTFTNARREGKVFSIELIDGSGDIKATAFGQQVDNFYQQLQVNKVYLFSRGAVRPANRNYNNTSHNY